MKCDKCGIEKSNITVQCVPCLLKEAYIDAITTGTAAIKMELGDNGIEVKKYH